GRARGPLLGLVLSLADRACDRAGHLLRLVRGGRDETARRFLRGMRDLAGLVRELLGLLGARVDAILDPVFRIRHDDAPFGKNVVTKRVAIYSRKRCAKRAALVRATALVRDSGSLLSPGHAHFRERPQGLDDQGTNRGKCALAGKTASLPFAD